MWRMLDWKLKKKKKKPACLIWFEKKWPENQFFFCLALSTDIINNILREQWLSSCLAKQEIGVQIQAFLLQF